MTPEPPSSSEPEDSEPATALVRQFEAGAELVADGSFTLDATAARRKLRAYRHADPNAWILFVVEAAHLFEGCTALRLVSSRRGGQICLLGVELDDAEMRGLFDAAVTGSPEARSSAERKRSRARQRLALAGASAFDDATGLLRSSGAGLGVSFQADGAVEFERRPPLITPAGPMLQLEVDTARGSKLWEQLRSLLEDRCRYATVEIVLDDEVLDYGLKLTECESSAPIWNEEGRQIGVVGYSLARQVPTMLLVSDGVLLETVPGDGLPRAALALVDVSDLPRDLSQVKLLRRDAYATRIAAVRAAFGSAQLGLAPPAPVYLPSSAKFSLVPYLVINLTVALIVYATVALELGPLAFTVTFMMLVGLVLTPWFQARRTRKAQREGIPTAATVLSRESVAVSGSLATAVGLELMVHVPNKPAYRASLTVRVPEQVSRELFEPQSVIQVRYNPKDPSAVGLELMPRPALEAALGPGGDQPQIT